MDISKYESSIKFTPEQFKEITEITSSTGKMAIQVAKELEMFARSGRCLLNSIAELKKEVPNE